MYKKNNQLCTWLWVSHRSNNLASYLLHAFFLAHSFGRKEAWDDFACETMPPWHHNYQSQRSWRTYRATKASSDVMVASSHMKVIPGILSQFSPKLWNKSGTKGLGIRLARITVTWYNPLFYRQAICNQPCESAHVEATQKTVELLTISSQPPLHPQFQHYSWH